MCLLLFWGCIQSLFTAKLAETCWTSDMRVVDLICVCVRVTPLPGDISSDCDRSCYPPVSPRDTHVRRTRICAKMCECSMREVWICSATDNAWLVSLCQCLVLTEPLLLTHARTHTHTLPFPSNLSCPELLSAIHFPVSQPSIIPACPQMQLSLLKTGEEAMYTQGDTGSNSQREGFLIKIAIEQHF